MKRVWAAAASAALVAGWSGGTVRADETVAVAAPVVAAASAFDSYLRRATEIDPQFKDGAAVASAVQAAAAFAPAQLSEGVPAYAALLALQDPAFVKGVTVSAGSAEERTALAERLTDDPASVLTLPDAPEAGGRAAAALGALGQALLTQGQTVRQSAYSVQHQPWSLSPVAEPARRLAAVKARMTVRASAEPADVQHLLTGMASARATSAPAVTPGPAVVQGLALAAVALLGQAGDEHAEAVAPLLADPADEGCLKMARLNLHQCLAVAGPHYEDVFCLGQHALADTGQCLVAAAGKPVPAPPRTQMAQAPRFAIPVASQTTPAPRAEEPSPEPLQVSALTGVR